MKRQPTKPALASSAHALNESEVRLALLASIVDSSDDAIVSKTLDGVVTSWNPAAEMMSGYQADEIIGKPFSILSHADRPDEMIDILRRIWDGHRVKHYETVLVKKDGGAIAVSLTVSPIHDANGKIIGASSIASDITVRKRVEELARTTSLYVRSLIEASADPLVTISPKGTITDVNEATIKATGVARENLVGTDFCDYFTEPAKARAGYQQVFAKSFVTDYPLTIRHRDGMLTDVLYNASVYKDARGEVLGVFAAARDVTAQRKAEEVIAEQRAKDQQRFAELVRFQKLTVGRELRMIELKTEIEELKKRSVPA
ncbi:MAG TPA: PAS domain S-box protein [Planctomycetota bacterium]|nr:PAS domain S-box protein [Planctomycetota bacterium]